MFCRNCGNEVDDKAVVCVKCGVRPNDGTAHCSACGKETQPGAVVCVQCGAQMPASSVQLKATSDKKLITGICGIVLGCLGVHKFILGYTTAGMIMLLVTLIPPFISCGILFFTPAVMALIGLIEGIIYLTKTDEEFSKMYIENQKHWF